MKKLLSTTGIAIVAAGAMMASLSAQADTVSNNAAVVILTPLTLTARNDMNFGKVIKPVGSSKTVIVSNAGALSGTATRLSGISGAPGTIAVTGDSTNATVNVTVTNTTTIAGLQLGSFTASFGGKTMASNQIVGATITGGSETLSLGATLTVDPTVASGLHRPTYDVAVVYN